MYQPAAYGDQDPLEAYWQLVNGVTLWDVGTERQVEITGPDALAFTNALTPRDLTASRVGRCCYSLMTDRQDKSISRKLSVAPMIDWTD
jgi:aminomethyltransferase